MTHLFTSESVSVGHPDKLADTISDSILDAILADDPAGRVACETLLTGNLVVIGGEVTTTAEIDLAHVVRETITRTGYINAADGLAADDIKLILALSQQSPEIAGGVFDALEHRRGSQDPYDTQGAGDQGIIFGYANSDNDSYFPVAGKLAHLLTAKLAEVRQGAGAGILLPDAKAQVTIAYEQGVPVAVDNVLISTQHTSAIALPALTAFIRHQVIEPVVTHYNAAQAFGPELQDFGNYLINPAGPWHVGGPKSDAGLTGRKIIVDSYCGYARHGGGAYSGKDPSKTDRSAAYAARWVAKNLVAAGVATELEIQLAYAIGVSEPVSISVDTRGKPSIGTSKIEGIIAEVFDLRPAAIIHELELRANPIYQLTATNGHFGRNPDDLFSWERLDRVDAIRALV